MLTYLTLMFRPHFWRNHFSLSTFGKTIFGMVGAFVAILETTKKIWAFHDKEDKQIEMLVTEYYWQIVFLLISLGIIIAIVRLLPTLRYVATVKKRDMKVVLEIGDLFGTEETLVIGTNRTFDTDTTNNLIHPKSLQAQFASKFFGLPARLDKAIDASLQGEQFELLTSQQKHRGKLKLYPIGATVKVCTQKQIDAYLVAIATMNGYGVASTSIDQFRVALGAFWQYVIEKGGGSPKLRMPVIGTGLAKLPANREEVIREILRSFFAASSADHFCTQLTIVITAKDFLEHEINLAELGRYLEYLAEYTEFKSSTDTGSGIGIAP